MEKILYTQRVEVVESYGERRDCADQNIPRFLFECGFLPVPVMNLPTTVKDFCEEIVPDGILLTGGNDLTAYGGNAPERDETEELLIRYARKNSIPILGICRGMQMIAHFFDVKLERIEGHVGNKHPINGIINRKRVNSFHSMGTHHLKDPLQIVATADDGVIEAMRHKTEPVAGIMWHPERVNGFVPEDRELLRRFFQSGQMV